jgi:hypothetical protein
VAHLELDVEPEESRQLPGATKTEWLCLLRQFPAAEALHVSSEISVYVALALEYIAEDITMVTGVLPYVDLICLEAQPVPSSVGKFVAMRRLAGRPVTVVNTTSEFDEILKSSYISE